MSEDFLKEYLIKISDDLNKVFLMIEKDRERDNEFTLAIAESRADRKALRDMVATLQVKVDKLAEVFGVHKKKGLWALLIATITGGAIASGTLNYQKLIEKVFSLGQ
jgi:hypothetical protein